MSATRTAGRTAIDSRTSVSRAPISVVIALSGGRFRVMIATRPSSSYSRSTGSSGSAAAVGGPKSSAFQRSVVVAVAATISSSSGVQVGQPAERPQAGCEAVLSAPRDDEGRHLLEASADRVSRDRERAGAVLRSDERVSLRRRAYEDPVVQP